MSDEIVKKENKPTDSGVNKLSRAGEISTKPQAGGLHARIQAAKEKPKDVWEPSYNRIKLLLDCSGSMGSSAVYGGPKTRMHCLHEAVEAFVNECSWYDTMVGFVTFGLERYHYDEDLDNPFQTQRKMLKGEINFPLTTDAQSIIQAVNPLKSSGGTPMTEGMAVVSENGNSELITRVILISDGGANNPTSAEEEARKYKELGIVCDTVSIGNDTSGEALLKRIAEITGGIYLKFTDVDNFAKSFKYLTPKLRKQLALPGMAKLIGASEVKG